MDKEKEIEKMTVEELAQYGIKYLKEKEEGYGNVKQAVKEFAERLKGLCDEKRKLFDKLYDNCASGQAQLACSFIERRNEWIEMKQKIDNLITELYGADE